jgi:accessory gene regulator B
MAERISDILISNEIITAENRDIYIYGLQQGMLMVINIATILVIGIAFNMVLESTIFLLTFIPLRSNAGGYHAKNQARCYLYSIVMITVTLICIKVVPWTGVICFSLTVVTGAIIFFFAPVEDANKPLDQMEKAVYKKRTRKTLSLFVLLILLFCYFYQIVISLCIIMGLVVLSIMLVLGRVMNQLNRTKK